MASEPNKDQSGPNTIKWKKYTPESKKKRLAHHCSLQNKKQGQLEASVKIRFVCLRFKPLKH